MARPKKPAKLKLIDGNAGHRKAADEPNPDRCTLDQPPRWLKGRVARKKWRELAPMLQECGIMAETDVDALALLCDMYEMYAEASEIVRVEGFATTSSKGTQTKHPAARVMDGAFDRYLGMLREFGMTPASRSNISLVPGHRQGSGEWDDFN